MRAQVSQANKANEANDKEQRKRPYVAPVLTKYGDIASLTRGAAGNETGDGGITSTT